MTGLPLCGCCGKAVPSLETVLSILVQVCAGLHHLHCLGIIHRDVRAANVLVTARDPLTVVIADFGVSHQLRGYATAVDTALGLASGDGEEVTTVVTGTAARTCLCARVPRCCGLGCRPSCVAVLECDLS